MPEVRVLVVDDSAFMRKMLTNILEESPTLKVVGTARDGLEGLARARELRPDVITLDVEMPGMDGLAVLDRVMRECPTRVVMVSSLTSAGAATTMRALHLGAIDFVHKPSGSISLDVGKVGAEIIAKVEAAAAASLRSVLRAGPEPAPDARPRARARMSTSGAAAARRSAFRGGECSLAVAVGTSTGGPRALQEVIPNLPGDLPAPIVIVQHMPAKFTRSLADRLDSMSELTVREAEEGDPLQPGVALIAPGGLHMRVGGDGRIHLSDEAPLWGVRPAVDLLMESVVTRYGARSIGVIMTGMGRDGARAMRYMKDEGGTTIAESEETCVIYGMPRAVVEAGAADKVVPLQSIPEAIVQAVEETATSAGRP